MRVFAGIGLVFLSAISSVATNSEEDTLKRIQQAKYNAFTGVWEIRLNEEIRPLEAGFKNFLPGLDYVLVDEKMRDAGRNTLVFRGQGRPEGRGKTEDFRHLYKGQYPYWTYGKSK